MMVSGTNQNASPSRNVNSGIFMRSIGRKRVILSGLDVAEFICPSQSASKRRRGRQNPPRLPNRLGSLPQDILIRILCGVNHSDLKQLMSVSKGVRDAAMVAKKSHFAFSTPLSKPVFSRTCELDSDVDAPGAPKQKRIGKSRIEGKNIASIAMALFTTDSDD